MSAPDHLSHPHRLEVHVVHSTSTSTSTSAPGPTPSPSRAERAAAVRRARMLNKATIGWNVIEGAVAVAAGVAAGSVSLIGFGIDSAIEVSAAAILAWRLQQETKEGCTQASDARATKAIAMSFAVLAAYVAFEAVRDLMGDIEPEASPVGVALAAVSLTVMPALARTKARLAPVLGSQAAASDAAQTNLCALLSAVVLVGLGLNWVAGWWWADPVAALGVGAIAAVEAVRTWRADSLEDTCCG